MIDEGTKLVAGCSCLPLLSLAITWLSLLSKTRGGNSASVKVGFTQRREDAQRN